MQVALFDFDWYPDALLFVVFAGLGLGVFVRSLSQWYRALAVCAVVALLAGQLYAIRSALLTTLPPAPMTRPPQVI